MKELEDIIRAAIAKDGAITVARYMELALQHPRYGYYRRRDPLGANGDFVTSPEISQMFGEMIGLWFADLWRQMGSPPEFVLLELGAGRGTLMQDALRATSRIGGFHAASRLFLLESDDALRQAQTDKLGSFLPVHIGAEGLDGLPPDLPLIAVANEFFDALPVHQLANTELGWQERKVGLSGESFAFVDPPAALEKREISPLGLSLLRQISATIANRGGAALIIDYGYSSPGNGWTLQAVSRHRYASPLQNVGETDLTAHVDFSAMKAAAEGMGAVVHGPRGQGEFLRDMGIGLRAAQLSGKASPEQAAEISSALLRLTAPDQMGTLFKAMAVSSPNLTSVAGF